MEAIKNSNVIDFDEKVQDKEDDLAREYMTKIFMPVAKAAAAVDGNSPEVDAYYKGCIVGATSIIFMFEDEAPIGTIDLAKYLHDSMGVNINGLSNFTGGAR